MPRRRRHRVRPRASGRRPGSSARRMPAICPSRHRGVAARARPGGSSAAAPERVGPRRWETTPAPAAPRGARSRFPGGRSAPRRQEEPSAPSPRGSIRWAPVRRQTRLRRECPAGSRRFRHRGWDRRCRQRRRRERRREPADRWLGHREKPRRRRPPDSRGLRATTRLRVSGPYPAPPANLLGSRSQAWARRGRSGLRRRPEPSTRTSQRVTRCPPACAAGGSPGYEVDQRTGWPCRSDMPRQTASDRGGRARADAGSTKTRQPSS